MNTPIPDFIAKRHEDCLREWMQAICDNERANAHRLAKELEDWLEATGSDAPALKLKSLQRFLNPEKTKTGVFRIPKPMATMWNFLRSQPSYVRHFPRTGDDQQLPASFDSWDHALTASLSWFLREGPKYRHAHPMEELAAFLPGRYVMYRSDMEPAARKMPPQEYIRASLVEVSASAHGLSIKELQDFKKTTLREAHFQINTGVIIPYGTFVIALMNGDHGDGHRKESFKCMVIESIVPVSDRLPVEEFKGKLMVASDIASAPSVKFICKRGPDTGPIEPHGIYLPDAIDQDVRESLSTPTFDKKYQVIS